MLPIISLGPLSMPTAPLILLLGFWLGSVLSERKAQSRVGSAEAVDKILWAALLAGLIGSRISFIARYPAAFQGQMLSMLSLNPALLDLQGGLLISLAVSYYLTAREGYKIPDMLDILVPFLGVMVPAIALSRFVNGTGFGTFTNLPWGIELWGGSRHPVQIYYAAAGVAAVLILSAKIPGRSQPGRDFLLFVILTSGYLTFLSAFQDPTGLLIGGLRIRQLSYWAVFSLSLFVNYWNSQGQKHGSAER